MYVLRFIASIIQNNKKCQLSLKFHCVLSLIETVLSAGQVLKVESAVIDVLLITVRLISLEQSRRSKLSPRLVAAFRYVKKRERLEIFTSGSCTFFI